MAARALRIRPAAKNVSPLYEPSVSLSLIQRHICASFSQLCAVTAWSIVLVSACAALLAEVVIAFDGNFGSNVFRTPDDVRLLTNAAARKRLLTRELQI